MKRAKIFFVTVMCMFTWLSAGAQELGTESYGQGTLSRDSLLFGPDVKDRDEALMMYDYVFPDNWFYMLHVGSFLNWGTNQSHGDFPGRFRPAVGVSFGKWFYPTVGARVQLYLGNNRGFTTTNKKEYHWQDAGIAVDGLLNVSNLLFGYREKRRFSFLVYLGMGGDQTFRFSKREWNTDNSSDHFHTGSCSLLSFRTGAMGLCRISEKWDISLELTNVWDDDSYDGIVTSNRWDGHVNLLLGFVRRLENRDKTHNFYYVRRDGSIWKSANDEVNRLRAETQRIRELPQPSPIQTQQLHTIVSFRNQLTTIDELQEVNVYTAVQAMRRYEHQVNLYITPLRTSGGVMSDTEQHLFAQRAETVRALLIQRYGITAERIVINVNASEVEQKDKETGSVVVYINQSRTVNDKENEDRRLKDIR